MIQEKKIRILPAPVYDALERRIIGEWLKQFLAEQSETSKDKPPTVFAVRADELVKEIRREENEKK